ncbi:MAG: hypothetical protein JST28_01135 [Acidobacteria bacterium]|nr:hypothetical protein [Acidobacteriota bacterium]
MLGLLLELCIQLVQGTDPIFAALMLMAQVCAITAFNNLGGMTHMTGAFCLFAILPIVTIPEVAHLALGQPGDLNLVHPLKTAGVCAVFFACMMVAAKMVSLMRHPVSLLEHLRFSVVELRIISVLACIVALYINFRIITLDGPLQDGSLLAALQHFYGFLLAISVMMATYVRIVTTGGRSVISAYLAFLLILAVVPGMLSASKEGMLTPLLCWLVVVASSRHRFSWRGIITMTAVSFVVWHYVYPFSQNARFPIRAANTLSEKTSLIVDYFRNPSQYGDINTYISESSEFGLETSKVGIVARYSTLPSIDMLIDADQKLGYTGIERYLPVLVSVVPHALWPDRPVPITSNELGHKAGFRMGAGDTTTGIAIGSPGLFFDLGGWLALIVYTLGCFAAFFFVSVRLVSKSQTGIWSLVPIGTEALIAGAAAPDAMFNLVVMFMGLLFFCILTLKVFSKGFESLISRATPRPEF